MPTLLLILAGGALTLVIGTIIEKRYDLSFPMALLLYFGLGVFFGVVLTRLAYG